MRRQTILLAAALAVITPSAGLTESRTEAREAALAIRNPESPTTPDRFVLRIEDAKTASSAIAPVDEASLLFELAEAHKLRQVAKTGASPRLDIDTNARAPSGGDATAAASPSADLGAADSTALEAGGFTAHHGVSSVHEFAEDRDPVSLNVAPITQPRFGDGDWETLRADDTVHGGEVSGVAVGLRFKLN